MTRIGWPGGKGGSGVAQTLINLMPPHDSYIEAFLGSGAVLRAKRPARSHNIGIDAARAALDLTRAAIAETAGADWDLVSLETAGPAGTSESDEAIQLDPLDEADDSAGGIARSADATRRTSPKLTLLQADAINFLRMNSRLLTAQTLVYCDPPYVRRSRRGNRDLYEHEMTDEQHAELLAVLNTLPCMVLLSGYASPLYEQALTNWHTITFHTTNRAGDRTTEHAWFNYPKPVELHDYRYLGKNFRERERIKRKMKRWSLRLARMPELERQALTWAMRSAELPDKSETAQRV